MHVDRRTVLSTILLAVLGGLFLWVMLRGPVEEQIAIAHVEKPPAAEIAQRRPDLMQHVFRFPRPFALESVRLIHLDADTSGDMVRSETAETPTIWLLEPDPEFAPSEAQAAEYHAGSSVKTQVLSIGMGVAGMSRTDGRGSDPLKALVPGGHYRLEVEGEGLSGSIEFVATRMRRR